MYKMTTRLSACACCIINNTDVTAVETFKMGNSSYKCIAADEDGATPSQDFKNKVLVLLCPLCEIWVALHA